MMQSKAAFDQSNPADDTGPAIGDTVFLKSGGPAMTIAGINRRASDDTRIASCVWFNHAGEGPYESNFPVAALDADANP